MKKILLGAILAIIMMSANAYGNNGWTLMYKNSYYGEWIEVYYSTKESCERALWGKQFAGCFAR